MSFNQFGLFEHSVTVLGDGFIEEVLVPPAEASRGASVRCWRVPSGAYLLAAMLNAAGLPVCSRPPASAGDPALIVELERRKIRPDGQDRWVVGVGKMR